MNSNLFLAIVALLGVGQTPKSDSSTDPFVVLDVALGKLWDSKVFTEEFVPPHSGTYWVELRYPTSKKQIDAKLSNKSRQLGQAIHESHGARLDVIITEAQTSVVVTSKEKKWTPVEIATKTQRIAADRLEFPLKGGVAYKLTLKLVTPSKSWQDTKPRLFVEMSDSLRNNRAVRSFGSGLWLVGAVVVLGLLIVCAWFLIRWILAGRRQDSYKATGGGAIENHSQQVQV